MAKNLQSMEEKVTEKNLNDVKVENEMLKKQLNELCSTLKNRDYSIALQRLSFLFDIVKHRDAFDSDTVIMAVDEIKETIFPPKVEEKEFSEE